MTTIEIASNAIQYLTSDAQTVSTISDYIASSLGEYAADHDVDAIEDEYREALQGILPEGVTLAGNFLYADADVIVDQDAIREDVKGIDFWAIVARNAA